MEGNGLFKYSAIELWGKKEGRMEGAGVRSTHGNGSLPGELLAPVAAEAMEEGAVSDDVAATAGDSDDSLQQSSVQLLETIDEPLTHDITGAPPLSSLEKDKEIDLELLQDLMEVDIDPLDIDLEKDPLAAKVFKV